MNILKEIRKVLFLQKTFGYPIQISVKERKVQEVFNLFFAFQGGEIKRIMLKEVIKKIQKDFLD